MYGKMKKNIAVILAGGVGSRLGLSTPKQFFKVAGKMVVEHTVEAFERNSHIDEIAIVSNPFYIAEFENMTIRNGWKKSQEDSAGRKGTLSFQSVSHRIVCRNGMQSDLPRRRTPSGQPAYHQRCGDGTGYLSGHRRSPSVGRYHY